MRLTFEQEVEIMRSLISEIKVLVDNLDRAIEHVLARPKENSA